MAVMASWNGKRWEVSPSRIMALNGFSTGYRLKNASNTDSEGKAPSDVRGLELMQLSFTTRIGDAAGVDVRAEIESWAALVGASAPFVLGGKRFGESDFRLVQVGLSNAVIDDFGRFRESELALQFEEFAGEAAKDKPKGPGSAAAPPGVAAAAAPAPAPSRQTGADLSAARSALGIGPSAEDKARMALFNPQMVVLNYGGRL
jgi:hypothetical protein